MRDCLNRPERKLSCFKVWLGIGLLWLWSLPVLAENDYATIIKQAQVKLLGNEYVLNAVLEYHLSPEAKTALLKGIALSWTVPIVLLEQRDYLWDKEILRLTLNYQVQYFALLNVYRVKSEHNGQVNNFASFSAALNSIARINALKIIDKSQLPPDHSYLVKLKVSFEREALPIPLRPIAYFDREWALSSDWFVCRF